MKRCPESKGAPETGLRLLARAAQRLALLSLFALFFLALSACTALVVSESLPAREGYLVYSNLIDTATKEEAFGRLKDAGATETGAGILEKLVDSYNSRMAVFEEGDLEYLDSKESFFHYQNGFTDTAKKYIDYGKYYNYMKKWNKQGNDGDILCRTAAFLLLQDKISAVNCLDKGQWAAWKEDDYLYSDYEAINSHAELGFTEEGQAVYFSLFHPAAISGSVSEKSIYQAVKSQWGEYGIRFAEGKISLISIWVCHDGTAHNSHAGVLVDDGEGLLFVEKTNPFFPYQATKFASREQLCQYMKDTLAFSFENDGLPVPEVMAVFENDELM